MSSNSTESQADQGNWGDHPREQAMSTVRVTNADRMMIAVTPGEDGISASFADGYSGTVPFGDIPEIGDASGLNNVELPEPIRGHTDDHSRRKGGTSVGLRQALLRPELPSENGNDRRRGEAGPRDQSQGAQGSRRAHSGVSCPSRRHRARHSGTAGKRKTHAKGQHAGSHSPGPGTASRRPICWS